MLLKKPDASLDILHLKEDSVIICRIVFSFIELGLGILFNALFLHQKFYVESQYFRALGGVLGCLYLIKALFTQLSMEIIFSDDMDVAKLIRVSENTHMKGFKRKLYLTFRIYPLYSINLYILPYLLLSIAFITFILLAVNIANCQLCCTYLYYRLVTAIGAMVVTVIGMVFDMKTARGYTKARKAINLNNQNN